MAWTDEQQDGLIATLLQRVASLENSSSSSSGQVVTEDELADYAEMLSDWTVIANAMIGYLGTNDVYNSYVGSQTITADNAWDTWCGAVNYCLAQLDEDKLEQSDLTVANLSDVVEEIIGNELDLDVLLADYIKATDIVTGTLTATTILSQTANFLQLITDTVTSAGVNAFTISSDHLTIDDAFITNAMIQSLSASKITAGEIDTTDITITGQDGNMEIADGTITIEDGSIVRVKIGKIDNDNYDMRVWDSDGNCMWTASGITADAIKSSIIVDDMISSSANISSSKLNISSLVSTLNSNGGLITQSSAVIIDAAGQTLSAWLSTIETWKTGIATRTTTLETQIEVINGELDTFVSQTDFTELSTGVSQLESNYTTLDQTVSGLSSTVASHTSTLTTLSSTVDGLDDTLQDVEDRVTTVEATASGLSTTVSSMTQTQQEMEEVLETLDDTAMMTRTEVQTLMESYATRIEQTESSITASVTESVEESLGDTYVTQSALSEWFTMDSDGLTIGSSDSEVRLRMDNSGIVFYTLNDDTTENEIGSWDGDLFHAHNIYIETDYYARFGNFKFVPRTDGSLVLLRV